MSLNGKTALLFFSFLFKKSLQTLVIDKYFAELRSENSRLISERQKLRQLVQDREEDVRVLRGQLAIRKQQFEKLSKD
jgi:hypothetical protein